MNRAGFGALGLFAGLFLVTPAGADAQTGEGWWGWALRDAEEVADVRGESPARSSDETRGDGRTIGDIIFGRGGQRDDSRRGDERRDASRDRDDRRETARRGGKDARSDRAGPPFCRNGQGHPVHGMKWCRDKGFDRGSTRWQNRGWEDVILREPRGTRRQRTVDQGGLIDVLGDVVFGRLEGERRRLGGSAPLDGRWLNLSNGSRVLQVRSGSLPVAELSDVDGDGRVDVALVPRR